MWKFVTRGIRESFERRACRTNVYSQTSPENTKNDVKTSLECNHKFIAPHFSAYSSEPWCSSTKTGGAEDKNNDKKCNTKHNWTEAVGWSGVLAVGWIVCQSLCLRRKLFNKEQNELLHLDISRLSQARISYLLNELLNLRPKSILPVTNCIGDRNKYLSKENINKIETEQSFGKTFGPITAEEALDEAADKFNNIHKLVMGESELNFGLKALDEKRYKDAMRHFAAGAKFSSPESMFNLGLCHELGLGTLVDYVKAASYYDHAAKHGHADAMYNLGVFHAQGIGGLDLDLDRARLYFTQAAQLGQTQAQHALNLDNAKKRSINANKTSVSMDNYKYSSKIDNSDYETTSEKLFTKLVEFTNTYKKQSHPNTRVELSECSKRVGDIKNLTELLLEYLGLPEKNMIPVPISLDDCRVQC